MADAQWIALKKKLEPGKNEAESSYERNVNQRHRNIVENALKSGYLKVLDEELILSSQCGEARGCKNIKDVLHIFLPRCHIQLLDSAALYHCTRLTICYLSSCYIGDITPFRSCARLLKLDLSNNQIVEVPDTSFWSSLSSLRVLYLHGNAIGDKECAAKINGCVRLHVLTLYNTPYSLQPGYRHNVVNSIVSLKALDCYVISDEEIIENLHLGGKFKSANTCLKLQLYQHLSPATSFEEERRKTYRLLLEVDRILAKHSPVIIIQRCVRGWLVRRALKGKHHSSVQPPHATSRVGGTKGVRPASRVASITEHVPQPHPPPPTPSYASRADQGGWKGGDASFRKKRLLQKKHVLRIDLSGGPDLEQSTSEANRSRSQTPRSRPNSHKGERGVGRWDRDIDAPASGPSFVQQPYSTTPSTANSAGGRGTGEGLARDDIRADCHSVAIQLMDVTAELAREHQQDGNVMRDAEREMAKLLSRRGRQRSHSLPIPAMKDQLLFTRAYVSMTVSALRTLEKFGKVKRKDEELAQKTKLVAALKEDHAYRAENIVAYRQSLKEAIHTWKDHHVEMLARRKKQLLVERNLVTSSHATRHNREALRAQALKEDREFEVEFNMQNLAIGGAVDHKDWRRTMDARQRSVTAMAEERREEGERGVALVNKYWQWREARLVLNNRAMKKDLKTKMREVTSQHQSEAKDRVAKVKSRKAVAKEAVLLTTDVVDHAHLDPPISGASLGIPRSGQGNHVASVQEHRSKVDMSPHMTDDGVPMLGHFPVLKSPDSSCLMFDMLKPTAVLRRNPWQPLSVPVGT